MWATSRRAAGQCAGQHEPPYGYAAAMRGLHERAMDRRGETASMRGDLLGLQISPTEERSPLPEGGIGG